MKLLCPQAVTRHKRKVLNVENRAPLLFGQWMLSLNEINAINGSVNPSQGGQMALRLVTRMHSHKSDDLSHLWSYVRLPALNWIKSRLTAPANIPDGVFYYLNQFVPSNRYDILLLWLLSLTIINKVNTLRVQVTEDLQINNDNAQSSRSVIID